MGISIYKWFKSVGYALQGFFRVVKEEQNMRIHVLAAVVVIILGIIRHISAMAWVALCIVIGFVFVLEIVNTAVERLVDMQKPTVHRYASAIKDMMAAAVLIGAMTAVCVGAFVFLFP